MGQRGGRARRTLVDGEVAAVAEDDGVGVLALAVVADGALAVLAREGVGALGHVARLREAGGGVSEPRASYTGERGRGAHEVEPLLFDLVHDDFKDLVRDEGEAVALAVAVERVEPQLVCVARACGGGG